MLLLTTWDPSLMSVSLTRSPSFLLSETGHSRHPPLHSPFHCFHNNTNCVPAGLAQPLDLPWQHKPLASVMVCWDFLHIPRCNCVPNIVANFSFPQFSMWSSGYTLLFNLFTLSPSLLLSPSSLSMRGRSNCQTQKRSWSTLATSRCLMNG